MPECPFCQRLAAAPDQDGLAAAFPDGFPVADGHTLVVPRRHCADIFDLSEREYATVWRLVREVRDHLQARLAPDGFNVGVNAGPAAGQTVSHAHVHLIPRRDGDVSDPRGGIRWVIPRTADYWTGS